MIAEIEVVNNDLEGSIRFRLVVENILVGMEMRIGMKIGMRKQFHSIVWLGMERNGKFIPFYCLVGIIYVGKKGIINYE